MVKPSSSDVMPKFKPINQCNKGISSSSIVRNTYNTSIPPCNVSSL